MAENMTYEDFKAQCVGLVCRQLNTATVTPDQLQGHFNALNFPVQDLTSQDRLLVHVFDVIMDHRAPIDFNQLTHLYKRCCSEKDLSLLPPPFGLDGPVPMEGMAQFVVITHDDGSYTIFKHFSFPQKINAVVFKNLVYGTAKKASFMSTDQKLGRKIIQYCLERMGGHPRHLLLPLVELRAHRLGLLHLHLHSVSLSQLLHRNFWDHRQEHLRANEVVVR